MEGLSESPRVARAFVGIACSVVGLELIAKIASFGILLLDSTFYRFIVPSCSFCVT